MDLATLYYTNGIRIIGRGNGYSDRENGQGMIAEMDWYCQHLVIRKEEFMILFKDIQLQDKELIGEYFHKLQNNNSECSFTNLYIWRKCYHVQWAIVEGFLVIVTSFLGESWILPPYGDYENGNLKGVLLQIKNYFEEKGAPFTINGMTAPFVEILEKQVPGWFWIEEQRDLFDYLYEGEKLRELKGKKYHAKRNHLNNFRKNNPLYQYESLTQDIITEVKDFLDHWCWKKECKGDFNRELRCEKKAVWEALDHFEGLGYTGGVIRIDGNIKAFTLGERLNNNTALIHIEKADSEIQGLYGAINQEYLIHEWPEIAYVNREEDMGDEGLRKAKLSYRPVDLVKKYKGIYENEGVLYCHKVTKKDTEAVRWLWNYCFEDSPAFVDWYFKSYYHPEYTVGAFENRQLLASAQMIPYFVSVRNRAMPCAYIVGVDTAPEARRGGIAKELLITCLKEMKRKGQPLSLLMPFEGSFYYRFQWGFCYFRNLYEIEMKELDHLRLSYGTAKRIKAADHLDTLQAIYEVYHRNHHGYVLRQKEDWELLLEGWELEEVYSYLLMEREGAKGYVFYSFEHDRMVVREMAFIHEMAKKGILNFIYGHRSHVKSLEWSASADDLSFLSFSTGKASAKIQPFLMARVVDVIKIWESLSYESDQPTIYLKIADQSADWNCGVFQLSVQDSMGKAELMGSDTQWDMSMGIESFTQLIMGTLSMDQLSELGVVEILDAEKAKIFADNFPQMRNDIVECY